MNTISKILLMVLFMALLSSMFSCSSKSGKRLPNAATDSLTVNKAKIPDSSTFRAKEYYIDSIACFKSSFTELIRVPLGYKMGDTICTGYDIHKNKYYILEECVGN